MRIVSLILLSLIIAFGSSAAFAAEDVYDPPAGEGNYILTPPAAETPRLTGPAVFGVRPGSPFLFTITATGKRPVLFAATGLPDGLVLDAATGRITGVIASKEKRRYPVTFKAANSLGAVEKPFTIVVGDDICLTPPLGWNSWNAWGHQVSQKNVLASARAMVDKGLANHGWTYINIDDVWQGKRGGKLNAIQPNPETFPDMKKLADDIHALGLKIGIYSTPWITSYANFVGGSSDNADGAWDRSTEGKKRQHGQYKFDDADAKQWAEWGIDYLKYDWRPNDPESIERMAKALLASGRDIVYSLSNSAPIEHVATIRRWANCWRTTGDLKDRWSVKGPNSNLVEVWSGHRSWIHNGFRGGPGHYPDADMLVVGHVIEKNTTEAPRPSRLTADEQYTHISLWSLWSCPMLIGCPIDLMDEFTVALLSNDEVLDVHQDANGVGGKTVRNQEGVEVIVKNLADGSVAVGLFNRRDEAENIAVDWALLGIAGEQRVRDLWRQKDIGTFKESFTARVRPHGVVMVRMSGVNNGVK